MHCELWQDWRRELIHSQYGVDFHAWCRPADVVLYQLFEEVQPGSLPSLLTVEAPPNSCQLGVKHGSLSGADTTQSWPCPSPLALHFVVTDLADVSAAMHTALSLHTLMNITKYMTLLQNY